MQREDGRVVVRAKERMKGVRERMRAAEPERVGVERWGERVASDIPCSLPQTETQNT